jgi:hypothetical protein
MEKVRKNARRPAAMRGNLVAQTAGSRRAELDVLHPATPAAQRPCQRLDLPTSAHTRRDGPGCRSTGRSVVAGSGQLRGLGFTSGSRGAPRVVRPPTKASPAPALRVAFDQTQRDVTVGYQPGGASRRVRGRLRSPGPLARSGTRRRSWQPSAAPPRVKVRRRARIRRWPPGTGRR